VRAPIYVMEEGSLFDGRSHMREAREQKNNIPAVD